MIRAYFMDRRGAGCVRTVATAAEAEKILGGGYGATSVVLRDDDDQIIGVRERRYIDGREQWWWTYEADAFEPHQQGPSEK